MTMPLPIMTDNELNWRPEEDASFGALRTPQGHLPLHALDVQTQITGLVARTTLRQTFINTYPDALEATYIFPLPSRAAVTHFAMEVDGRVIEGQLKERGQARQEYTQAIQQGHRAAIAEQERPDVFTIRAGNLAPNDVAVVEMVMIAPLEMIEGEVTWRFPLVVAPRYIPGNPLDGPDVGDGISKDTDAVPDASRISPPVLLKGYPNPVALSMQVDIDAGSHALSHIRSSLHAVDALKSTSRASVRLQPGERVDRDFILRFMLSGEGISHGAIAQPDIQRPDRHVVELSLIAPTHLAKQTAPRDVVFVLDRSGSMHGWKMVAARRAMARMLDTLTPKDRFLFMAFDNGIDTVPEFGMNIIEATNRNRYRALEYIAKIDAQGGTEMARPLQHAFETLQRSEPGRHRTVVLVTDGQVGNEDQILRQLAAFSDNIRVFTVGIDRAVNEGFLRRLAEPNGGRFELVESEDRLDEAMDRIHRMVDTPVLHSVSLEVLNGQMDQGDIVPGRLPDLFAGTPMVVRGMIWGLKPNTQIRVRAKQTDGTSWIVDVPVKAHEGSGLAPVWARAKLRQMEDEYTQSSASFLVKMMTDLSLNYRVLCRFTAFVAVDRAAKIERDAPLRQVTQAVETPSGWGNAGAAMPAKTMMPTARGFGGAPAGGFGSVPPGGFGSVPPAAQSAQPAAPAPPAPSMQSPIAPQSASFNATMDFMDLEMEESSAFDSFERMDAPKQKRRSRRKERESSASRHPGSLRGNLDDMGPEQIRQEPLTYQTHLYALMSMLYRLSTGRKLFTGSAFEQLSKKISAQLPQPLFSVQDPAILHALEHQLRRSVGQSKPAYQNTFEWIQDMQRLLSQQGAVDPVSVQPMIKPTQQDTSAPAMPHGSPTLMRKLWDRDPATCWLGQDAQGQWVTVFILNEHVMTDAQLVHAFTTPTQEAIHGFAPLLDFGTMPSGQPYVVRQFVEGMSLQELVALQAINAVQIVKVILQAAQHLSTLEQYGLIHRELSPDAIICTPTGDVVWMDMVAIKPRAQAQKPQGFFEKAKAFITGKSSSTREDFWK